jgi:predicted  nucleic acid-binding Zn-ribbon protein
MKKSKRKKLIAAKAKKTMCNESLANLRQRPKKLNGQNLNLDVAILALRSVKPTTEEMEYALEALGMKYAMRVHLEPIVDEDILKYGAIFKSMIS